MNIYIKELSEIKGFGSFVDYKWDRALSEFKKVNLVYGWNGSGKTTLSKIFHCFEDGVLPLGKETAKVSLKLSDDQTIKNNYTALKGRIKVFNRDYVEKNIQWDAQSTNSIVYVGKKEIDDAARLKEAKKELEDLGYEAIKTVEETAAKKAEDFLGDGAAEMRGHLLLSPNQYNRRHFKDDVDNAGEDLAVKRLSGAEITKNKQILASPNDKKSESMLSVTVPSIEEQVTTAIQVLSEEVKEEVALDGAHNPVVKEWLETGHGLHESQDDCIYCTSNIPTDRKQQLDLYFNDRKKQIKSAADQELIAMQGIREVVSKTAVDSAHIYTALHEEYQEVTMQLSEKRKVYTNAIVQLEIALEKKKLDFICDVTVINELKNINAVRLKDELQAAFNAVDAVIKQHEDIFKEFDDSVTAARGALKKHYLADFVKKRRALVATANNAKKELTQANEEKDKLEGEIAALEQQDTDYEAASGEMNALLKWMGHPHIELIPHDDGYQLQRNGFKADNLSEGERTAITFAHFIASLKQKGFDIKKSIIVIDDPISSLDMNVLYAVFSVIKAYTEQANQLFLMTHHHGFYTLLLNWVKYIKKNHALYSVEREYDSTTGEPHSRICNQDDFLKKYDSEYHYLFALMYKYRRDFSSARKIDANIAYPYLNIARKLLEIFLRFKYPNESDMSRVFSVMEHAPSTSDIDRAFYRKVRTVVMEGSHTRINSIHEMPIFSFTEEDAKTLCDVPEFINKIDADHYGRLIELCDKGVSQTAA